MTAGYRPIGMNSSGLAAPTVLAMHLVIGRRPVISSSLELRRYQGFEGTARQRSSD